MIKSTQKIKKMYIIIFLNPAGMTLCWRSVDMIDNDSAKGYTGFQNLKIKIELKKMIFLNTIFNIIHFIYLADRANLLEPR